MTALAKLESALRGCVEHMEHSTPQGRSAYEQALAALSPAELGGVEAVVGELRCDNEGGRTIKWRDGFHDVSGRTFFIVGTTPRAAEAVTEEMVERACIEDASESYPYTWDHLPDSVKVRRRKRMTEILASALTPPSAKGENSNV